MKWERVVSLGCVGLGIGRVTRRSRCVRFVMLIVFVSVLGTASGAPAAGGPCPNAKFRVGHSAGLPDCRAYELVTPASLGRTQALTFTGGATKAAASGDGEAVALETIVPLEPNASTPSSVGGARAVFSRNSKVGWEMKSLVPSGASGYAFEPRLFSPDLSQVAFESSPGDLNLGPAARSQYITLEVGQVGGPYTDVATTPWQAETSFVGASADFSDVLFTSLEHAECPRRARPRSGCELPLSGAEEEAAVKETDSGAPDLYDWTEGGLRLVNAWNGRLVNRCGATLGAGILGQGQNFGTVNAVASDGATIFFTAPYGGTASEPGCTEPARLYMRVNGGEPVEVAKPEEPGVEVGTVSNPLSVVRYNYATPDGSEVFFNTEMALTSDDSSKVNKLFEYDADEPEGRRLKRIASGVPMESGVGIRESEGFFFSEDGSTVYAVSGSSGVQEITRYDTSTGESTHVAHIKASSEFKRSYSTPSGEFFLFPSTEVENEPRGAGHEELYRYSHADGSVICVTCGTGPGPAPEQGMDVGIVFGTTLSFPDALPQVTEISENGQEVFFQTTAQLVPQDTNSTKYEFGAVNKAPGLDVYEWEADGTGGCELAQGCTYLLSSGEASGPSHFIDASANGRDVFFESPAQLVPQATPEFPNIYDARVNGGFAPPSGAPECLSCQGVGSPPPLFSSPASTTFAGAGNPAERVVEEKSKREKRRKARGKRRRGKSKAAGGHRKAVVHAIKGRGRS